MREAYIVESVRTPGCKRAKGLLSQVRPEDIIKAALAGVMERSGVPKEAVEDVMCGCAFPEAEQGLNVGRIATLMAGFPDTVCGATINRFCSSGLEAIAISSMRIIAGMADVTIGAGLESMSIVPMGGNLIRPHPEWAKSDPDVYIGMGMTAENVARRYNVTREDQDYFAMHSHMKAAKAQKECWFKEIVPVESYKFVQQPDGSFKRETFKADYDDGVKGDTTVETISKLRGAFAAPNPKIPNSGSVTAANSSQTTDGAAATLIMCKEACEKYSVKPKFKFNGYVVAGCKADEMGVGPAVAIPKLFTKTGINMDTIKKDGLIELNEAFAAQGIYCCRELGIGDRKYFETDSPDLIINPTGGAIALGHPLGCSGAKITATLFMNMERLNKKYGIVSMCIGGGMGAAALFERVN